jgi:hypothetical protein
MTEQKKKDDAVPDDLDRIEDDFTIGDPAVLKFQSSRPPIPVETDRVGRENPCGCFQICRYCEKENFAILMTLFLQSTKVM